MDRTARTRTFSWPGWKRQESLRPGHRARGHPARLSRVVLAKRIILAWLEELADATLDGNRKQHVELLTTVPLLIIDDLGNAQATADRRRGTTGNHHATLAERASTLITSNRPVDDWGKLLGDSAAVSAMLDRLLHHWTCAQVWTAQAGEPRPAVPEKTNDKTKNKNKS